MEATKQKKQFRRQNLLPTGRMLGIPRGRKPRRAKENLPITHGGTDCVPNIFFRSRSKNLKMVKTMNSC
jgi:hypothetical protein